MIPDRHDPYTNASPEVVAGLGCRRGCAQDELLALLVHNLERQGLTVDNLVALASITHKRDEPSLHALAQQLRLELSFFSAEELAPYQTSTSAITLAATGSPAVAEPCALALAARLGAAARQLGEKTRSASATCALATFDRESTA